MKQSSKKHELGTAALYCRLSRDDNMDSESNSIQNQRKILQKAAKDKGYTDTVFFVDDGITGTTMKRPGFQKMLTAIEAGYISAVFVKDLSRLGRNYIEVGKLTEEFFPLHDIRLVAVSDGVDSDEGEDDFTPFKNIMNEYYAKDISKKRRIVNKMKGNAGVPLSPPPYGYIKNPDDPRFWVVEPEAAEVVRRIYRMALEGYGLAETAAQLAADGVVNPTYYWRSRGTSRGGSKSTVEPTKWGHTTVKKILTLQEYCGDVINFKSYSKSYKMKKRIENPEENRAIFLNVHEAIIDRQTWEKVQALQKGRAAKAHGHAGAQRILWPAEMPGVRRQPQFPLQPEQPRHQVFQLPKSQLRLSQVQQDALYPAGLLRASRFVRGQAAGLLCQRIRK